MGVLRTLCVIGLGLLSPGCALVGNSVDNVFVEGKECLEEHVERARDRKWAEIAWERVRATSQVPLGDDYAAGFKEGFANYLFEGGAGEPPPLPPRRYWGLVYQTPQGDQAIQNWFAGYRHGVIAAQAGGFHQWVPSSTSLRPPPFVDSHAAAVAPVPPPPQKMADELPPPQKTSLAPPAVPPPPDAAKPQPGASPALFYSPEWSRNSEP